ncbi:hypothetical protein RC83_21490, partial [Pectobacterium brasiliense]
TIARSGCLVLTWRISSWFGAQKPHQKPDICLQLPILHLAEKRLVQPGASIYAAKACATLGACRKRSVKPDIDEDTASAA